MKKLKFWAFLCLSCISMTSLCAQQNLRIKDKFDFDWLFSLSDQPEYAQPDYNDQTWETVQLPHDWNIKQDFEMAQGGSAAYLPDWLLRKVF